MLIFLQIINRIPVIIPYKSVQFLLFLKESEGGTGVKEFPGRKKEYFPEKHSQFSVNSQDCEKTDVKKSSVYFSESTEAFRKKYSTAEMTVRKMTTAVRTIRVQD